MFDRIKAFASRCSFLWNYSGTAISVARYVSTYPGCDNETELRLWLRPMLLDCSVLASITQTPLDDAAVLTALKIVDNDKAWTACFALVTLAFEMQNESVKIPGDEAVNLSLESCCRVFSEIETENPVLVISAIGLLIQVLSFLRKR